MIYFVSSASQDGSLTITTTFEVGTDIDRAVVQLNNRVQVAFPRLPDEVRRNGIIVAKRSPDMEYIIPFDTTLVVKASIHEVEVTIFEAALLVLAVVFVFLQTWRATVIPM